MHAKLSQFKQHMNKMPSVHNTHWKTVYIRTKSDHLAVTYSDWIINLFPAEEKLGVSLTNNFYQLKYPTKWSAIESGKYPNETWFGIIKTLPGSFTLCPALQITVMSLIHQWTASSVTSDRRTLLHVTPLMSATSISSFCSLQFMTAATVNKHTHTHTQPFYCPFSGTTRVSRCQKRASGLYGARED